MVSASGELLAVFLGDQPRRQRKFTTASGRETVVEIAGQRRAGVALAHLGAVAVQMSGMWA